MNYKIATKVLVAAFVLGLTLPVASFAATTTASTTKDLKAKAGENICSVLIERLGNRNQQLADKLGKLQTLRAEQLKRIGERRLGVDEKRLGVRTKVDENRDNRIAKLEARATTTEQKTAVATFRATLASTTEARRLAVDAAVKTYRDSADQTLNGRKTIVEAARVALKSAIDAALAKAKTDCASGIAPLTVRTETKEALKKAQEQFATAISGVDKTKPAVDSAIGVRREAVSKAQVDFKAAYEKALADLKAVFQK